MILEWRAALPGALWPLQQRLYTLYFILCPVRSGGRDERRRPLLLGIPYTYTALLHYGRTMLAEVLVLVLQGTEVGLRIGVFFIFKLYAS